MIFVGTKIKTITPGKEQEFVADMPAEVAETFAKFNAIAIVALEATRDLEPVLLADDPAKVDATIEALKRGIELAGHANNFNQLIKVARSNFRAMSQANQGKLIATIIEVR